jgi:hypothetical protein
MPWRDGSASNSCRRMGGVLAWISLALCVSGCITVAHGLIGRDGPDTARRVARAVPDGAPEADARRIMEANGYECRAEDNVPYPAPNSNVTARGRILGCGATPGVSARGGFLFSDEYYVGFLVSDGRAHLLVATVNATGS